MAPITPHWAQPSHPHLVTVISCPEKGAYTSSSRSLISLPPGALLARLGSPPLTAVAEKAYSTVQVSATQHVELNCDFLYTNHSCEPSVEFRVVQPSEDSEWHDGRDLAPILATTNGAAVPPLNGDPHVPRQNVIEVRAAARKDVDGNAKGLAEGDELTFFYPSTEWEMAQPFKCSCGARTCQRWIAGARDLGRDKLAGLFLNDHILELLEKQERERSLEGVVGDDAASDNLGLNGIVNTKGFSGNWLASGETVAPRHGASARALAGEMGGDTVSA